LNILITGGTGFVGQHLLQKLSKESVNILVLARKKQSSSYIDIYNLVNVKFKYNIDILNTTSYFKYFENIDVVIHLAGFVSFKQRDKKKLIDVNYRGTLNILKACEKYKIKKFINISSTAALGFSDNLIDENFQFNWSKFQKCVYSYSKYLVNDEILKSKCNSIIVYPALILGPGDKGNSLKFVQAIQNEKIPFNLPGRNSLIDVRDFVESLSLLIKKDIKNKSYIVVNENYSFKEINGIISKVVNVTPPQKTIPYKYVSFFSSLSLILEKLSNKSDLNYENIFLGFQNREHDNTKIKELGFKPKYSLKNTVKDIISWCENIK